MVTATGISVVCYAGITGCRGRRLPAPRTCRRLLELGGVLGRHDGGAGVDVRLHGLALDRLVDGVDAQLAHLGRELRDARVLGSGLDRGDLVREASNPTTVIAEGSMFAFLIASSAPMIGGPQAP